MSSTMVYGCDWCQEIVPKNSRDEARFAATVTIVEGSTADGGMLYAASPVEPVRESICRECRRNLQALRQGRVRR